MANTNLVKIDCGEDFFQSINQLKEFGGTYNLANEIFASYPNIKTYEKDLSFDVNTFNRLKETIRQVIVRISTILLFIEKFTVEDMENQINLKLPEHFPLANMSILISVFNNPTFKKINDNQCVEIYGVDKGSSLLLIGSLTIGGAKLILKFAKEGIEIAREWHEMLITREKYKALKVENETKEAFLKLQLEIATLQRKDLIDKTVEKYSSEVLQTEKTTKAVLNDDTNNLRFLLEKITNSLLEGIAFYPSLASSNISDEKLLEDIPNTNDYDRLFEKIEILKQLIEKNEIFDKQPCNENDIS